MEQFNKAEFEKRINNGYFRKKYGLDTSKHSEYWTARMNGKSDLEAQSMIFKRFLKENTMEKKEKYKINDRDYFIDKFRNYIDKKQLNEATTPERDMLHGIADQLKDMYKEIEKEYSKFNDKKVLLKIKKYQHDAVMSLYNLADYIEENLKFSDKE